jgi:5-methylcytosine-specific restriction endonuclease McrBC regulatory subunit McrC
MNRLFENFLLGLLKKKLKNFEVRGMGHGMSSYSLDIAGKMAQKPDIVIRKGNIDLLAIDAKYKRLQTDKGKQAKIIISDTRQVWSYCLAPDRKLPCGVLVYPKHWLSEDIKSIHALKNNVTLIIKTLDVSKEQKKDFIEECDRFAYEIKHLIEQEGIKHARN